MLTLAEIKRRLAYELQTEGQLTPETQELAGAFIRSDTPVGFELFFELTHNLPLSWFARKWVEHTYGAHASGMGAIIRAFRGASKTTVMATHFIYRLGCNPTYPGMILQVSDESAEKTAAWLAKIVEHSPAWRLAFPNVKPDTTWGAEGYELVADRFWVDNQWVPVTYAQFRQLRGRDASFVGHGVDSGSIIGKRVMQLLADDLHDQKNTKSQRMLASVRSQVVSNVDPTLLPGAMEVYIGTPWVEDDVLDTKIKTGAYWQLDTPIQHPETGEPTWPEWMGREEIEKRRQIWGEIDFARMGMLDIEAAKGLTLKWEWWIQFPYENLLPEWPVFTGTDYASSQRRIKPGEEPDHHAIGRGVVHPEGFLVLTSGWFGHGSQNDVINRVVQYAVESPYFKSAGIEAIGTGKELFESIVARETFLNITPVFSHQGRAKGERFEQILAPLVQRGVIRMSTAMVPYLYQLEREWKGYPLYRWDDVLDSIYMLYKAAEPYLVIPTTMPKPDGGVRMNKLWRTVLEEEEPAKMNAFSVFGDSHARRS